MIHLSREPSREENGEKRFLILVVAGKYLGNVCLPILVVIKLYNICEIKKTGFQDGDC